MEILDIDVSTGIIDTIPREREGICANYDDAIRYISRRLREGMTYEKWNKMYIIDITQSHWGNSLMPWQFGVNVCLTGIGPYRADNRSAAIPLTINCWSLRKINLSLKNFEDHLKKYVVYKDEFFVFKEIVKGLLDDIKRKLVVTYHYEDNDEYTV